MTWESRLRDHEDRAGIEAIDVLLAERQQIVDELAPLRARFGPGGTWDHERKLRHSQLEEIVRVAAIRDKQKVTEAFIEQTARNSDGYAGFIQESLVERTRWAELEERLKNLDMKVMRGQALLRYLAAEVSTMPR